MHTFWAYPLGPQCPAGAYPLWPQYGPHAPQGHTHLGPNAPQRHTHFIPNARRGIPILMWLSNFVAYVFNFCLFLYNCFWAAVDTKGHVKHGPHTPQGPTLLWLQQDCISPVGDNGLSISIMGLLEDLTLRHRLLICCNYNFIWHEFVKKL